MKEVELSSIKTKVAKKEYLKSMLATFKIGDRIKPNEKFYNILKNLTEIHPSSSTFTGKCSHFEVHRCVHNPINKNMSYVNTKGEKRVFSIYAALDKPKSKDFQFKKAMRDVVKPFIQHFKNMEFATSADSKGYLTCPISGLKFQPETCHIDHKYPLTFDSIANTFLQNEGIDTSSLSFVPALGTEIEALAPEFEDINANFYEFHAKVCDIQAVYWRANLQGKRNKEVIN